MKGNIRIAIGRPDRFYGLGEGRECYFAAPYVLIVDAQETA
jgi:hypothetical protein